MQFLDKDFLLKSEIARDLFENHSKDLPIYDYHCHLSAQEIYEDKEFNNLYEIWLKGDHYKWRLMRFNGVNESIITGNVDPYQCFRAYVDTLERAIDNPLYHWSHLELRRCFNINDVIKSSNAQMIWDKANKFISDNKYSPRKAIAQFNVDAIVTTEEVFSDLKYHKLIREDSSFKSRVLPSFRGDKIVNLDMNTIDKMGEITGGKIDKLDELLLRILIQLDRFKELGAVVADMAFEGFEYAECDLSCAYEIYDKAVKGSYITPDELRAYQSFMMLFLMREYYKRGWAVLLHIGAKRNNNTKGFKTLGADVGYDSVSDKNYIEGVNRVMDELVKEDILGKTIVYNLNPADNYLIATNIGNYASSKAKMQMGISWWFVDNKYGIIRMMEDYASLSHLGNFLGMLTDSRSFISYTRHEYFRRILCNYIANLVEGGEYPDDKELYCRIIEDISYNNAKRYFG